MPDHEESLLQSEDSTAGDNLPDWQQPNDSGWGYGARGNEAEADSCVGCNHAASGEYGQGYGHILVWGEMTSVPSFCIIVQAFALFLFWVIVWNHAEEFVYGVPLFG